MGWLDKLESASGVDLPDSIAGVDIPNIELGDIAEFAGDVLGGGLEMADKALKMRPLIARNVGLAGDCWGVVDVSKTILSNISSNMDPLMPIFRCQPDAVGMLNRENLDKCVNIILEVLNLGKLFQKMSDVMEAVRDMFAQIMETCGDVLEQAMEIVGDVASAFAEAMNLTPVLEGIEDMFERIVNFIAELADISGVLNPICEALADANFLTAGVTAASNFEEVCNAMQRFMPSWDTCLELYETLKNYAFPAYDMAKAAWAAFKPMLRKICKFLGMSPPGGLEDDERLATPRVAPRGGLPPPPPPDVDSDDGAPGDHACNLPPDAMPPLPSGHPVLMGFADALQAEYRDGQDCGVGAFLDSFDWDGAGVNQDDFNEFADRVEGMVRDGGLSPRQLRDGWQ